MRCTTCNGNGHRGGDRLINEDCHRCNGSGEICALCRGSAPNGDRFCETCRDTPAAKSMMANEVNQA